MSGYVVCPACGSRIKAGRGHCLRCFETLPVEGAPETPQPWYRTLQLSQGATLIAGVVLTLAALLFSAVIWQRATPPVDEVARPAFATSKTTPARGPAPAQGVAPAAPSDASAGGSARPPILDPGFIDTAKTQSASSADPAAARPRPAVAPVSV